MKAQPGSPDSAGNSFTLLHLVAGSTGAGKTSYARSLSEKYGGLLLSIDPWMSTLFGPDQPATPDFAWLKVRTGRCEEQMWELIHQCAHMGLPVIADCGFTRRDHRARWRDRAMAAGIAAALHHLDVPVEVRWNRVQERNQRKGATFSFEVSRAMFDFIEGLWQPPSASELQGFAPASGSR